MNVYLIGMMGSGKTAVGRRLAHALNWNYADVDQEVEREQSQSISEIFEVGSEAAFRAVEQSTIRRLAAQDRTIVSTGGGAPCFEENWSAFSNGLTIWLKAKPETLLERVKRTPGTRPLLRNAMNLERIRELLSKREPFYSRAGHAIETDGLSADQVAERAQEWLKGKI